MGEFLQSPYVRSDVGIASNFIFASPWIVIPQKSASYWTKILIKVPLQKIFFKDIINKKEIKSSNMLSNLRSKRRYVGI